MAFSDDPATRPGKAPRPDVDAVLFAGIGRWNGRDDGSSFEPRAIDRGEPGRGRDEFALTVRDPAGALVASVSGLLDGGNIEAMKVGK